MRSVLLIQFALLSMLGSVPAVAQVAPVPSLLNVSSFMMPPRASWASIGDSADASVNVTEHMGEGDVGFRVLHLRAAVKGSKQAALDLARSKLLQPGDILLSFRPLWDKTLAYAHMQLGVSHSAMAFIVSDAGGQFVMTLRVSDFLQQSSQFSGALFGPGRHSCNPSCPHRKPETKSGAMGQAGPEQT